MDNERVRLIDANRLIKTLRELEWITDNPCDGDNVLEDIINNEPVLTDDLHAWIDIAEKRGYENGTAEGKKTGYWKNAYTYGYSCSECGTQTVWVTNNDYGSKPFLSKYCPNCGTYMRGKENEADN